MEKKLINLVKEHEFLYNRKATYYKDLARKEEKWTEIADELSIEVKKAKQRWKSLRDRFAREYGKMRSTGAETQDVAWKYFDSLLFLKDCTEPRERNVIKQEREIKSELNPKNINELFSTFLSENEESGQGTSPVIHRIHHENGGNFQKNLPVLFKIERSIDCSVDPLRLPITAAATVTGAPATTTSTNIETTANDEIAMNRHQQTNQNFQKDPILISFDNGTLTAKAAEPVIKSDPNRYIHAIQNETFIRSFFNAMAVQVEQANLNFQAWATIQQEVMEVVNRNIIQSIHHHQQTNRHSSSYTQTHTHTTNGTS